MLPIVIQVQSIDRAAGGWVRHVTFPDFPECAVYSETVEEGIDEAFRLLNEHLEATSTRCGRGGGHLREGLEPLIELYRVSDW